VTLAEQLLAIHRALDEGGLPHAFGGAIALAYWTLEPRGTRDLDVNIFVGVDQVPRVVAALPPALDPGTSGIERLARDGQTRMWWDDTPVDVFLDYAPIHHEAADRARRVPFAGHEIPVLGPVELAAFKAMFDRTKDWADIEAMLAAGTLDVGGLRAALARMIDPSDARWARLEQACRTT
jgi:hypothetical protein